MTLEDKLDIDCIHAAKIIAPHLELSLPKIPETPKLEKVKSAVLGPLYKSIFGIAIGIAWAQDSLYLLTHPKYWKQHRGERKRQEKSDRDMLQSMLNQHDKDERQLEDELVSAGTAMPQGRQAFTIAHCTGLCIKHNSFLENYICGVVTLRAAWTRCNDGYYRPKILDEKGVDQTADISTVSPIEVCYCKEDFEQVLDIAIQNGVRCLNGRYIINHDFNEKAKDSLLQEVYSRLNKGKEFELLDAVSIRQEADNKIYLKAILPEQYDEYAKRTNA